MTDATPPGPVHRASPWSGDRLRALFCGLVEVRALGAASPRANRLPRWLEACWVGTAMELEPGDLTCDARANGFAAYLQAVASQTMPDQSREQAVRTCLAQRQVAFRGTGLERLLHAAGAAAAFRHGSGSRRVVLAYVRGDELSAEDWKRFARLGAGGGLPLIVVAAASSAVPALASPIHVIAVEGSDVLAISRVAQESILRARAEGGLVVIHCVPPQEDPVALASAVLLAQGVCSPDWLALFTQQTVESIRELADGVHWNGDSERPEYTLDRIS